MVFSDMSTDAQSTSMDGLLNPLNVAYPFSTTTMNPTDQGHSTSALLSPVPFIGSEYFQKTNSKEDQIFAENNLSIITQATLRGTQKGDRLVGTNQQDTLNGKGGNDVLLGKGKGDRLVGSGGNDRLNGGGGSDTLLGGKGRDILIGGAGRDILNGGVGKDIYHGGRGKDTIILGLGDGGTTLNRANIVKGFQDGKDSIQLNGMNFDDLIISQGTGTRVDDTIIQHRETGEYLLICQNIDSGAIASDDFITSPSITEPDPVVNPETASSFVNSGVNFSSADPSTESEIQALGGSSITVGSQSIYIGYRQVSSTNQNPILVSFDSQNSGNTWVRTDYEITGADSRGYGLFWSGSDLYAVFSIDGAQGSVSEDFRRASGDATQSWLRSYGSGGGAKISVVARIDIATGELLDAAHLSALLSSGKSNSLVIEDISTNGDGNLVIQAQSYFAPRNPDGSAMTQIGSGSSPFDYTVEITPDLKRVVSTAASGWQ